MNKLSRSEAEAILKPHLGNIRSCIVSAWDDYKKKQRKDEHKYETRTKASIIRDYIVDNVRHKFTGSTEVNCLDLEQDNLFLLEVAGIRIRFKKLSVDLKASNYLTNQAISYSAQQYTPGNTPVQLDMFPNQVSNDIDLGYADQEIGLNLNAGYVPDEHWEKLRGVYLVCPDCKKIAWFFDLSDNEEIIIPEKLPAKQNAKPIKGRAKIKGKGQKKSTSIKEQKDGTSS